MLGHTDALLRDGRRLSREFSLAASSKRKSSNEFALILFLLLYLVSYLLTLVVSHDVITSRRDNILLMTQTLLSCRLRYSYRRGAKFYRCQYTRLEILTGNRNVFDCKKLLIHFSLCSTLSVLYIL